MIDTTTFPAEKFVYKYLAGPVDSKEEIDRGITEGNCRFAPQLYFWRIHNIFLEKDQVYLPGGYKVLGKFIFKEELIDFNDLKRGDILYAQNLRNKSEELLERGIEVYKDKDEWIYYFHSAIYLGRVDPESDVQYVWHATSIEGGPALWTLETFLHYYKPISIKRILG